MAYVPPPPPHGTEWVARLWIIQKRGKYHIYADPQMKNRLTIMKTIESTMAFARTHSDAWILLFDKKFTSTGNALKLAFIAAALRRIIITLALRLFN